MTLAEIEVRIVEIRAMVHDDERAHGLEDSLRTDVLTAIAAGAPDAQLLARAALTTGAIDFCRWCA